MSDQQSVHDTDFWNSSITCLLFVIGHGMNLKDSAVVSGHFCLTREGLDFPITIQCTSLPVLPVLVHIFLTNQGYFLGSSIFFL